MLPETPDFEAGAVILIDKPLGWTSFDVVAKIRNALKVKKVGHAGTLDPLATGLLILCTGRKTKEIQSIQDADKAYRATFALGATTASYDAETPRENERPAGHLTPEDLRREMLRLTGPISQVPPAYSAVKVSGKRAYELARQGKEVELKARTVNIHRFELTRFTGPEDAEAEIECTKGTYIRTLVHDLGQQLGVGAYLTGLVRTRIGSYDLQDAYPLTDFLDKFARSKANAPIKPEN